MLKEVFKIDVNGFIINKFIAEFDEHGKPVKELEQNIIAVDPPQGLYKPKWDGTKWIETMTEAEYIATLPLSLEQQISELKVELSETDYKIIKCYEYQLVEKPLPYDISALHNHRQILRDGINDLEVANINLS